MVAGFNVQQPAGDLRVALGGGVGAPGVALHGDGLQRGLQIRHVHARADVLLGDLAQPGADQRAHLHAVLAAPRAGGGGGDQIVDVALEDVGFELVQRAAHGDQQGQLVSPLVVAVIQPDLAAFGDLEHVLVQDRQVAAQAAGQVQRLRGGFLVAQRRAVPGAGGVFAGERAELGGALELRGDVAALAHGVQHRALEPHRGGRRRVQRGEPGQLLHRLVRRAAPAAAHRVQRLHVLVQRVARFAQALEQVAQLRFGGAFVAQDGPGQLLADRVRVLVRLQQQAGGVKLRVEALDEFLRGGALLGDDQHALALGGQHRGGIQRGLRGAGAGGGVDRHGFAGGDVFEHAGLRLVGVQQVELVLGVALVRGLGQGGVPGVHLAVGAGRGLAGGAHHGLVRAARAGRILDQVLDPAQARSGVLRFAGLRVGLRVLLGRIRCRFVGSGGVGVLCGDQVGQRGGTLGGFGDPGGALGQLLVVGLPDQGLDDRVRAVELGRVGRVDEVGEGGQQQAVAHNDAGHLGDQVAQGVHAAHRVEAGNGIGGGVHRGDVDLRVVIGLELAHERRGDGGAADQLDVVVVGVHVLGQGDAPEHDRGGDRFALALVHGAPVGDAGGQVAHVDAALVPQLADLGGQGAGGALGGCVLLRVVQQGGQAGASTGQELGQSRGVGVRDVDAVGRRRGEPQSGVGPGALPQGFHPVGYSIRSSILSTGHDSYSLH